MQDAPPVLPVQLTRAQHDALARLGAPFGQSPEAVARTAIQVYLDQQEMQRAGIRPEDLPVLDSAPPRREKKDLYISGAIIGAAFPSHFIAQINLTLGLLSIPVGMLLGGYLAYRYDHRHDTPRAG